VKIATWNIERLKHKCKLTQITEICERISADILVLTETDSMLNLKYKYCFQTLPPTDQVVSYKSSENRVTIYTNYKFVKQHVTFDNQTAICVELSTDYGNLLVYGVVMGVYGNRHKSFMTDLPLILSDVERLVTGNRCLCVSGDFNCSFSDNYYYTKMGRTEIEDVFKRNEIKLLTREQPECIDHIAISRKFVGDSDVRVGEWNHDKIFSDHKGIFVELMF
jgi:endonuclease/exonuclease/phosphatase family metal-dependent hydrolase